MSWTPSTKEIENVLALDASRRCKHCIKKVVDQREVWSMRGSNGWIVLGDSAGREMLPIWPHKEYVRCCMPNDYSDCFPQVIPLRDFLDKWLPGLEKDGRLIAVFPTSAMNALSVEPHRLLSDLREELKQYEAE